MLVDKLLFSCGLGPFNDWQLRSALVSLNISVSLFRLQLLRSFRARNIEHIAHLKSTTNDRCHVRPSLWMMKWMLDFGNELNRFFHADTSRILKISVQLLVNKKTTYISNDWMYMLCTKLQCFTWDRLKISNLEWPLGERITFAFVLFKNLNHWPFSADVPYPMVE